MMGAEKTRTRKAPGTAEYLLIRGVKSPAFLSQRDDETAYCASRAAASAALALASTDSCARAAHRSLADAYRRRLEMLDIPADDATRFVDGRPNRRMDQ